MPSSSAPAARESKIKAILEKQKREIEKYPLASPYYCEYFQIADLRNSGIVQHDSKSWLDRVQLDGCGGELVHLFGFSNKDSRSYFELTLSVSAVHRPQQQQQQQQRQQSQKRALQDGGEPARWYVARAKLVLSLSNEEQEQEQEREQRQNNNSKQAVARRRYTYECEQLLDYEEKRRERGKHENRDVYKVGSLSVETVLPYSLTRIHFNGLMRVVSYENNNNNNNNNTDQRAATHDSVKPIKLTISTHPTCDKFFYPERFDREYQLRKTIEMMNAAANDDGDNEQAMRQALPEFRLDQPLMFQGRLEELGQHLEGSSNGGGGGGGQSSFIMWGAKVKQYDMLLDNSKRSSSSSSPLARVAHSQDCLFAWSECGQQIHLSRPTRERDNHEGTNGAAVPMGPGFVEGMVHSSYDYASPLHEAKLYRRTRRSTTTTTNHVADAKIDAATSSNDEQEEELEEIKFDELRCFGDLKSEHVIKVRAFKVKEFTLEFLDDDDMRMCEEEGPSRGGGGAIEPTRIRLNGFQGWAVSKKLDLGARAREAQEKRWTLTLHDDLFTPKLACESLLGGKGNSLVNLAQMVAGRKLQAGRGAQAKSQPRVLVPRGLVVTTEAHRLWLSSNHDTIVRHLGALDALRLKLAANTVHPDPMSSAYVSASEAQRQLRELSETTCRELRANCSLPAKLVSCIRRELELIFGRLAHDQEEGRQLNEQEASSMGPPVRFAVRSSCVGEDSLETSAAGQMKTLLGVGMNLNSICESIVECWSSQYEVQALTYKSQNGLAFNLPMAVVVQELVECHAAGVAATCDPLTGNKCQLEITANLGMGENVVAGKRTDTIRVQLGDGLVHSSWDTDRDDFDNFLNFEAKQQVGERLLSREDIVKLPHGAEQVSMSAGDAPNSPAGDHKASVCLSDEQILALSNLLLDLRRQSGPIKEREVEWGITLGGEEGFVIHLLQSRPLTHLQRLSALEIDHELDSGLPSPIDKVTRANLGEVMPGAMCPLYSSWLMPLTNTLNRPKEAGYSRQAYVGDQFASHSRLVMMVVTHTDLIRKFVTPQAAAKSKKRRGGNGGEQQLAAGEEEEEEDDTTARDMIYSMIGSTFEEPRDAEERAFTERFLVERMNPLGPVVSRNIMAVLAADAMLVSVNEMRAKRTLKTTILQEDLVPIDQLAGRELGGGQHEVFKQIRVLFGRLMTRLQPMKESWMAHMYATMTNMTMNVILLKLLCAQPAYKEHKNSIIANEVLNDFSVLVRGGSGTPPNNGAKQLAEQLGSTRAARIEKRGRKTTESGDISKLLELLLERFVEEDQLEHVKTLSMEEMHKFLNSNNIDNSSNAPARRELTSCKLYRRFIRKNGHRAFKEFDFATKSWSDDQSYILRLLVTRLRSYTREEAARQRAKRAETERAQVQSYARVEAKVTEKKWFLTKVVLPRVRNATVRRESTKSLLMRAIHKYRLAFRHLGGLLCLAGLMPSADLIFFLTIEEIDEIIKRCCGGDGGGDGDEISEELAAGFAAGATGGTSACVMPRLLYKARRRQQRARAIDKVTFPRPTMTVSEMLGSIREQTERSDSFGPLGPTVAAKQQQQQQAVPVPVPVPAESNGTIQAATATTNHELQLVKGITSCAGRVTGRACVIASIDEVDQLEPDDILITYSIDISWSVYFYQLAGIVTELGGIVSHGAVVAREYGIPTLCTAVGACSKFKTGQLVTLDASNGVCHLHSKQGGD